MFFGKDQLCKMMWAKRQLTHNTPASAIIRIYVATTPYIIANANGSSEIYAGIELADHPMGKPKDIIFHHVNDVIMGKAENRTVDRAEDGPGETSQRIRNHIPRPHSQVGATALPSSTAPKRNRKRKAPESDKAIPNDETATNDANYVVEPKRSGASARSNHSFWRIY